MQTPTPDQLRAQSDLIAAQRPQSDANDEVLAGRAAVAAAVVASITGRLILPVEEGEEVPAGLVPLAVQAVAMFVERRLVRGAAGEAEAAAGGRRLRSFTAGPYSESYFAPGELGTKGGRPRMDVDEELDALLWALATDEAREEFIAAASGVQPPAGAATEFDYRRGGYGRGLRAAGFGAGPDGF